MSAAPAVKVILGYDIVEGVSVADYEAWLADIHFPDLLENPFLDRIVPNTVLRPITTTSVGTKTVDDAMSFYRIVELHFADRASYDRYLAWFETNPIPQERGPAGRTEFRFYVLADSFVVDRQNPLPPTSAS